MGKVIAARLIRLIATLLAVTFLTFSMTALLPGDPVNAILGVDSVRDPEVVAKKGSVAAAGLARWVHAMIKYDKVAKNVE